MWLSKKYSKLLIKLETNINNRQMLNLFSKKLTHSAREYFEKVALKKNKTCNFKRSPLKSSGQFWVETNIFRKFIQFCRGLCLLQPPVPLPAARRAQRVIDEPVKVLNFLFFVYFIWKWGETLEKWHFFTSGPK